MATKKENTLKTTVKSADKGASKIAPKTVEKVNNKYSNGYHIGTAPSLEQVQKVEQNRLGKVVTTADNYKPKTPHAPKTEEQKHDDKMRKAKYNPTAGFNADVLSASEFNGANKHYSTNDEQIRKNLINDLGGGLAFLHGVADKITLRDLVGDDVVGRIYSGQKGVPTQESFARGKATLSLLDKNSDAHKTAYNVGEGAGTMASYAMLNPILKSIPALATAEGAISNAVGGGKLGQYLGETTMDIIPDILLDTTPEAIQNVKSGMPASDVAKEALKNIGVNELYNLGAGALPYLGDAKQSINNVIDSNKALKETAKNFNANGVNVKPLEDAFNSSVNRTTKDLFNVNDAQLPQVGDVLKYDAPKPKANVMAESIGKNTPQSSNSISEQVAEKLANGMTKDDAFKSIAENTGLNQGNKKVVAEISDNDGLENASKFYTNTVKKTSSDDFYKEYIEPIAKEDNVVRKSDNWKNDVAKRRIAEDGAETWADRLINADDIGAEDVTTYKMLKEIFDETNPELSAKLTRSMRPHITNSSQVLQATAEMGKTMPEMNLEIGLAKARKVVDDSVGKQGFSDAVNNVADKVQEAIEKGKFDEVKKMLKEKLSKFAYGSKAKNVLDETYLEGEQMVLDLIGGYSPDKKSLKELAEEVSSVMRKQNGVADFSYNDEIAITSILKQMENYETNSREYKELQAMAASYIDDKIPVKTSEKIKTVLYDNMLGNFRTAVSRNFGGNAVANALEKSQKPLKTGIDSLTSKVTKKRNYILNKEISDEYFNGFKKGWKDQIADIKSGLNTTRSGEEEFADALNNVHRAFKGDNNVSKVLNGYDRIVKNSMQLGDRPFYEAEYAAAKKELELIVDRFGKGALQKTGLPAEALENTDTVIAFLARQRALEACFQNGSLSSNALTQIKSAMGSLSKEAVGVDVLSQSSMPFTQVAGNMFGRLTDYIPVLGSVKNALNTIGEAIGKNFNQRRFVDATARNITGLGLLGGGYAMAKNVAEGGKFGITGDYSDDLDEKNAQISSGFQPYSLQIPWGDGVKQTNIDDIPIFGPGLKSSAKFYEGIANNKGDLLEGLYQGISGAISSSLENASLQGLNRLTGQSVYGNSDFGDNVLQTVAGLPGQAIPSLIRQATQTIDPYKRDLGEYGTAQYAVNNVINSTPFRMLLNPKLDNEGNPILQNQGRNTAEKILENFFLPWAVSEPQYSDLTQVAQNIKANSSDSTTKAFATAPSRNDVRDWLGDNYSESNYYQISKEVKENNSKIGNDVINSDFFKGLNADEQGEILSDVYGISKALSRVKNEEGYSSDSKSLEAYQKGGTKGLIDYYKKKYAFSNADISSNNKIANEVYSQGNDAFNELISKNNVLSEYGYNLSEENLNFFDDVGENAFKQFAKYVDTNNLKNNTQSRNLFSQMGVDGLSLLKSADTDKSGTLKKDDELLPYLKSKGYTLDEVNTILPYLGWKPIDEKKYSKY